MIDYDEADPKEYVECEACNAKPGQPRLCRACYHNRSAIQLLKDERDDALVRVRRLQEQNAELARSLRRAAAALNAAITWEAP